MRPVQARPNAPVQSIESIVAPGFRGLNTELNSVAGDTAGLWAADLQEAVFDEVGVTSRKGWEVVTDTPMTSTPTVLGSFEYEQDEQSTFLISQTADKIWASSDDGATWSDITGSVTWTNGRRWKFVNFYGVLIGGCFGETLITWNGSGNAAFITAASGSVPVCNGALLAAYGRVWVAEDGTGAIVYCALLDHTLWATADGGGAIDTSNAWTQGTDTIVGMAAAGATFGVWGSKHVLLYTDGAGSSLGIDPDNMYVIDTIEGTGAICRDGIINVGNGDIWFLSKIGVQSLKRVASSKENPLTDITRWIRSLMKSVIANQAGQEVAINAIYNEKEQFALFLFPGSTKIVMIDTRYQIEDGTFRCAEWNDQAHTCMVSRRNGDILFGRTSGVMAKYTSYVDDLGGSNTIYPLIIGSPWLGGGGQQAPFLKIPKRVTFDMVGTGDLTITTRWGYDFRGLEHSLTQTLVYNQSGSEYALGEWGEAEFADGERTRRGYTPLNGNGRVYKIWHSIAHSSSTSNFRRVACRNMTVYARLGRAL